MFGYDDAEYCLNPTVQSSVLTYLLYPPGSLVVSSGVRLVVYLLTSHDVSPTSRQRDNIRRTARKSYLSGNRRRSLQIGLATHGVGGAKNF